MVAWLHGIPRVISSRAGNGIKQASTYQKRGSTDQRRSCQKLKRVNVEKPNASESFELEPVLRNALIEASKNRRTAETILIISAMFEKYKLIHISANDLALVVRSLQEIGFDGTVDDLIKEIVTAHLIEKYWQEEI